ncbi:MAG: hypothetical protein AAF740_03545 [Bacteroidota bacterium]
MSQAKVLIASVLKPVNDVRAYQKIGRSLATAGYEVHIAGYAVDVTAEEENITFHPIFRGRRLSLKRVLVGFRLLYLSLRLRPNVLVIEAFELAWVCFLIKILCNIKLIIDFRENYSKNVRYQSVYPEPLKWFILMGTRFMQAMCRLFVDHYWLAERSYAEELRFTREKATVIENKALVHPLPVIEDPGFQRGLHFGLVGTFNEHYGTLQGMQFIQKLQQVNPDIQLSLVGYCSDEAYRKNLLVANQKMSANHFQVESRPIPHKVIEGKVRHLDCLLLPYLPNPSTERCIPTKFFEALALRLPMIIQKNPFWEAYLKPYQAAIFINFQEVKAPKTILQKLLTHDFYPQEIPSEAYSWETEAEKVKESLREILKAHTT